MEYFVKVAQVAVALSVVFVWTFRFHNVIKEFKEFGISDLTRSFVGASKIALSTLLIVGIWHHSLVLVSSIVMGFLMISAQYFHFSVKNPFNKKLPSLILLILCGFIAYSNL